MSDLVSIVSHGLISESGGGSIVFPDPGDVRYGVDRGDGVLGTLVVPSYEDVRYGTAVDDTVGSLICGEALLMTQDQKTFLALSAGRQLWQIKQAISGSPGFQIPQYDDIELTYYGSTNNVETVVYKNDGATVATLTLTYVGGGAADNDNVESVVRS